MAIIPILGKGQEGVRLTRYIQGAYQQDIGFGKGSSMQGWKIFTHSMRMVFGNLGAALRISLVLYLVQAAGGIYFMRKYGDALKGMDSGQALFVPSGFWGAWFITTLVGIIASLWIAVGWHRFILLEEKAETVLPPFNGGRIGAYFFTSIIIVLLMGVIMAVGISIVTLLGLSHGTEPQPLILGLILVPALYIFYRLCLALPAAALGEPIGIGESWRKTKPASGAIAQLVVIGLGATALVVLPSYFNSDPSSIVNIIYGNVLGWVVMIGGVSVLTTLYGVYVEGREL